MGVTDFVNSKFNTPGKYKSCLVCLVLRPRDADQLASKGPTNLYAAHSKTKTLLQPININTCQ